MTDTTAGLRVRVQSVLYGNSWESTRRFTASLERALAESVRQGVIGEASVIFGDSSGLPCLHPSKRDEVEGMLGTTVTSFDYDFFGANLGSAAGHNRLMATSDAELLLIINPDTVAGPTLLSELLLPLSEPLVGAVEARQLPLEHPKPYDHRTGETPWVTTACTLFRRRVVDEVGMFDADSFFLYCDDVDYSWRIRLSGHKLVFQPAARVFHDKRVDGGGHMRVGDTEVYYSAEAALMMMHKYSRPDLVERTLEGYLLAEEDRPLEAKAAHAFLARRSAGTLPAPIDPDHTVSEFVDGHYAVHRF